MGKGTKEDGSGGDPETMAKYRELERQFIMSQQKIGDALTIVQSIRIKKEDKDRIMNCLYEN